MQFCWVKDHIQPERKKVLILAYDFPPYVSVGGLRPYGWFSHLSAYDVDPVVVTRQWQNKYGDEKDFILASEKKETIVEAHPHGTIIRAAFQPSFSNRIYLKYGPNRFRIIRKGLTGIIEFAQFLLPVGSKYSIYQAADTFLKENKVDCILATGDPFVLFHYASELSKKYRVPWIADYRDTWVEDKTRSKTGIQRLLNRWLEKRSLKNVTFITTVSTFIQSHLQRNIKEKTFVILQNGYDDLPETTSNSEIPLNSTLTLSFAGTIYKWHPIDEFLEAVQLFKSTYNADIHLRFYGINNPNELLEQIENNFQSLSSSIEITPKIAHDKLFQLQKRDHLLILFNDYSILGTKIFNYLALKKPIVLCFTQSKISEELKFHYFNLDEISTESSRLQEELLERTQAGVSIRDKEHLVNYLGTMSSALKKTGKIPFESNNVENYSRKKQVVKLAKLICELSGTKTSS